MSDFSQVPVLLLHAVNALALKAYIASYPQGTIRHIAWLQAVVWACLGAWRFLNRRVVLQTVARQVSCVLDSACFRSHSPIIATECLARRTITLCAIFELHSRITASQPGEVCLSFEASYSPADPYFSCRLAAFSAATVILSEGTQVSLTIAKSQCTTLTASTLACDTVAQCSGPDWLCSVDVHHELDRW